MNEIKLTIRPFEMETEKEPAIKVLKEAAEVYAAWQEIDGCGSLNQCMNCEVCENCESPLILADEIADVIQASCNLAARCNIDLQAAMNRCKQRNRERRRYPMEDEDATTFGTCGSDVCDCCGDCGAVPAGVGDLPKSPDEMNTEELIEALSRVLGSGFSCRKPVADAWCKTNGCASCARNIFSLFKAARKCEMENAHKNEEMRHYVREAIARDEIAEKQWRTEENQQWIAYLTHKRDDLKRRIGELSDADTTSPRGPLRETIGDAKNVTDTVRTYVGKARESRKPDPERKAVIERLMELDFSTEWNGSHVALSKIGAAILGNGPVMWYPSAIASLRDELVALIDGGDVE